MVGIRRLSLRVAALLAPFATGGCSQSEMQHLSEPIVVDSAAVTIVRSMQPRWEPSESRLSDAPTLELVSREADVETVLYQVAGVVVDSFGRVVVANRGDGSLRMYARTGEMLWKAGRRGDGPGEFGDLRGVVIRGGELWAYQTLPLPIHVFSMAGDYQRSVQVPRWSGAGLVGVFDDGTVVAMGRPTGSSESLVFSQVSPIVAFRNGASDTVAVLPTFRLVNTSLGPEWQGLGPVLSVAASADHIYAGFGDSWDISVWDRSSRLVRRIRRDWAPLPITASQREAYGRSLAEAGGEDPAMAAAYRQLAEEMIYPEAHPAFDRLLVDTSERLWARGPQTEPPWNEAVDYAPVPRYPMEWDVFGPDGAWLSTVTTPAGFRVLDVGSSHVAGVAKDALGVERVQVWDLVMPG